MPKLLNSIYTCMVRTASSAHGDHPLPRKMNGFNCIDPINSLADLITDIPIPDLKDPDLFDPSCDPENPVSITYLDVSAAHYRIRDGIIHTPCKKSQLSKTFNMNLYLKLDFQQVTGSFKERGARNFLLQLTKEQRRTGVIASSAGNHAQALAYHGKDLGIPVTVIMPTNAPLMKVENCVGHGANVLLKGADMSETKAYALKVGKINNIPYVNGYDHPYILAGQGTVALEIMEQVPDVDAILVPVGGGGLIAGVAVAVKGINPHVKVIGVESDRCAAFGNSMSNANGKLTHTPCQPTIADVSKTYSMNVPGSSQAYSASKSTVSARRAMQHMPINWKVRCGKNTITFFGVQLPSDGMTNYFLLTLHPIAAFDKKQTIRSLLADLLVKLSKPFLFFSHRTVNMLLYLII
ncbi:hypothetical protein AHF37_05511 [Paragonimus kellicotti]|nr:hypothetical protein AHF37_05511 [Paragonimus kellicotti]